MGLRAATFLGPNTVPILAELTQRLRDADLDIELTGDEPGSSGDATERARDADLVWACGCLTVELVAAGNLHASIVAGRSVASMERPAVTASTNWRLCPPLVSPNSRVTSPSPRR